MCPEAPATCVGAGHGESTRCARCAGTTRCPSGRSSTGRAAATRYTGSDRDQRPPATSATSGGRSASRTAARAGAPQRRLLLRRLVLSSVRSGNWRRPLSRSVGRPPSHACPPTVIPARRARASHTVPEVLGRARSRHHWRGSWAPTRPPHPRHPPGRAGDRAGSNAAIAQRWPASTGWWTGPHPLGPGPRRSSRA
jgi:hypothetical protein